MRVFKKKVLVRNQPWKDKKRRRRERSNDDNRSQPNHIPLDLTLEILSRLPPKSIMRHRCVSKLWSSITRLPSFINLFTSRSSARLLLTFEFYKKQLVFSFPQNQNTDGSYSPVYSHHMTGMHYYKDPHSESVQGLVLLRCLQIWNPSLCQVLTLPHHKENNSSSRYMFKPYLGYDPLEGKHKVLYLFYGKCVELQILTLGANESWRRITKGIPMHSPTVGAGLRKCFNGVLYFEARAYGHDIIMSFDVKSESFSPIHYPKKYSHFRQPFNMIPYEGRLALVTDKFPYGGDVELYILKDASGYEWTRQHWSRVPCKREWRNHMQFRGITDAGELIFAPRSFAESFYILYFDPRRKSTREEKPSSKDLWVMGLDAVVELTTEHGVRMFSQITWRVSCLCNAAPSLLQCSSMIFYFICFPFQ